MKKRILIVSSLFILLLSLNINANTNTTFNTNTSTTSFKIGEKIVFDIHVTVKELGISGKLGTQTMVIGYLTNIDGRIAYYIVNNTRAVAWVAAIYDLHDIYETWVDVKTLKPLKIRKTIKEGKWTNLINIDPTTIEDGYYTYYDKRNLDGKKIDVPTDSRDIISMLFYLRDTKKTGDFTFNWFDNEMQVELQFSTKEGKPKKIKAIDKKEKLNIIDYEETSLYGINVSIEQDKEYIPVEVVVGTFNVSGFTIEIKGIIKEYYSSAWEWKEEYDKQVEAGVFE